MEKKHKKNIANLLEKIKNIYRNKNVGIKPENVNTEIIKLLFLRLYDLEKIKESTSIETMVKRYKKNHNKMGKSERKILKEESSEFFMQYYKFLSYDIIKNIKSHVQFEEILNGLIKYVFSHNSTTHSVFKGTPLLGNGSILHEVFHYLDKFPFENIPNFDIFGYMYEISLKTMVKGRDLGQYFTVSILRNLMVQELDLELTDDGCPKTIFDPTMGSGGFLITALDYLFKKYGDLDMDYITENCIHGIEIEETTFWLAHLNILLTTKNECRNIVHGDCLKLLHEKICNQKFDYIFANPPFGTKSFSLEISEDFYEKIPIRTNDGIALFLQLIIHRLKVGGKASVVLPFGKQLLSASKEFYHLRKYLFKIAMVWSIFIFPKGMFENTGNQTCVINFQKKCEIKDVIEYDEDAEQYKYCENYMTNTIDFFDVSNETGKKTLRETRDIEDFDEWLSFHDMIEEQKKGMKSLFDLCNFEKKSKRKAGEGMKRGEFPFYTSSVIIKRIDIDDYNFKNSAIIIGTGGNANVHRSKRFSCSADTFVLHSKNEKHVSSLFIYYYLKNNLEKLSKLYTGTTIAHFTKEGCKKMLIKIPTRKRQKKIIKACKKYEKELRKLKIQEREIKEKEKKLFDEI